MLVFSQKVVAYNANLTPPNIRYGVNIGGVIGANGGYWNEEEFIIVGTGQLDIAIDPAAEHVKITVPSVPNNYYGLDVRILDDKIYTFAQGQNWTVSRRGSSTIRLASGTPSWNYKVTVAQLIV